MGELRDRFWELPLGELSRAEWEALCDGCGRCCLHKIEDEETGEISGTNVACRLLDTRTAQCADYRNRKAFVPDCLRLTLKIVQDVITLLVFVPFSLFFLNEPLKWNYVWAALCMVGAVYFVFTA